MKSSILHAGVALACALGLSACGGGSGDLPLTVVVGNGITKTGLVLRNERNGDELVVDPTATGSTVAFPKYISTDDEFNITVKTQPANTEKCTVANPKARANYYTVAQISVSCTIKLHDLSVTVNGLSGNGLVLINGGDRKDVPVGTPNPVAMSKIPEGGLYGVTVYQQPAGQKCSVVNGSGVVGENNVTDVVVNCGPAPAGA